MVGSWGNCTQDNTTDCTSFQFRNVFCEQILANNVPSLVSLREFKKQNKSPKRWTMVSAPMLVNRLLESRFFIDQALCIWRNIWICQFCRFATKRLRTTFPRRTLDQLTLLDLGLDAASSAEMELRQERWQNSKIHWRLYLKEEEMIDIMLRWPVTKKLKREGLRFWRRVNAPERSPSLKSRAPMKIHARLQTGSLQVSSKYPLIFISWPPISQPRAAAKVFVVSPTAQGTPSVRMALASRSTKRRKNKKQREMCRLLRGKRIGVIRKKTKNHPLKRW